MPILTPVRNGSPRLSRFSVDTPFVVFMKAALVEMSNLRTQISANPAQCDGEIFYCDRAPRSLDTEILAGQRTDLDVGKYGTTQIQERGEGSRHRVEKDSGHGVSNSRFLREHLVVDEVAVQGCHIDDVRGTDWSIDWQLGVIAEGHQCLRWVIRDAQSDLLRWVLGMTLRLECPR